MATKVKQNNNPVRKLSRYSTLPREEILRKNVLEKTPYTDQARQAMQNVPIKMYGAPNTNYPEENAGGFYNGREININSRYSPKVQERTLMHEFLHSQDANINGQDPISYIPKPGFLVDSDNFYNRIPTRTDKKYVSDQTSRPLYDDNNKEDAQYVLDTEGMAYIGQHGASPMQNEKYYQQYKNLYQPISKALLQLPSATPKKAAAGASVLARLLSSSAIQRELKRDPKMVDDIVAAIKQLSFGKSK